MISSEKMNTDDYIYYDFVINEHPEMSETSLITITNEQ